MYVCICNAVCDKRVGAAVEQGHQTADAVYEALGVTPRCRSCAVTIEEMVEEKARQQQQALLPAE